MSKVKIYPSGVPFEDFYNNFNDILLTIKEIILKLECCENGRLKTIKSDSNL
jgi:hypothetical protein